jgi:hypothetical protein
VLEIAAEREAAGFAKGETAGEVKGEVKAKVGAILAVLVARGIAVSGEARARIEACKDGQMLDRWIGRAATMASAEDVISQRG